MAQVNSVKNALIAALEKSATDNSEAETDKNVQSGATDHKGSIESAQQGKVGPESTGEKDSEIHNSEKSATEPDKDKEKDAKDPKDDTEKSTASSIEHGLAEADKVENGKDTDGDGADDSDKSATKSLDVDQINKSMADSSAALTKNASVMQDVQATLKSLPAEIGDALAKTFEVAIEAALAKNVQSGKNSKDLTHSEKDIDGSQDQSQKSDDDEDLEESADKNVQSGKNAKDLTQSEKSATKDDKDCKDDCDKDEDCDTDKSADADEAEDDKATKSLEGSSKAVQTDESVETTTKSVDAEPEYTKEQIIYGAKNLEKSIAQAKVAASESQRDQLGKLFEAAKSVTRTGDLETLKNINDKFTEICK